MENWQDFENKSCEYLKRKFGEYADFSCEGGSDSTRSDINVVLKNGHSFYVEAKYCPAQCGQFVLLPDISTKTFIYSRLNEMSINNFSSEIIEFMNSHFEEYKEAFKSLFADVHLKI